MFENKFVSLLSHLKTIEPMEVHRESRTMCNTETSKVISRTDPVMDCGINPKGGIKLPQLWHSLQAGGIKLSPSAASELFLHINAKLFVTSRI